MEERDGDRDRAAGCFVLELHDVGPHCLPECEAMLEWGRRLAASAPLLMWTPRWGGLGERTETGKFLEKIFPPGGEIVLHGVSHRSPAALFDRIWYGEDTGAEFKKLGETEAFRLLQYGKSLLEEWWQRPVRWFCAPRWQQSRGTAGALRQLGFEGYFTATGVILLGENPRKISLPVISFDHGTRKLVNRVNRLIERRRFRHLFRRGKPFRLALHPRDMQRPPVQKLLENICRHLTAAGWRPVPLETLLELKRGGKNEKTRHR